jgi:uncharacterized membrane protein YedE/YeeE
MRRSLAALGAGLLFGAGLVISGMADPRNVVAFLDFTSARFSPNLAAVMVGGIGVHLLALRVLGARDARLRVAREGGPLLDARLLGGAAIFGVGWGLAGYCPGPALVALGFGAAPAWGFVAAMVVGVLLGEGAARRGAGADAAASGASVC